MPSANTVAQKPAGNSSPLSSLGHVGVLVSLLESDWLRADAIGSIKNNTARQDNKVLFARSRRIDPPEIDCEDCRERFYYISSCSYSRSISQLHPNLRWEDPN